MKNLILLRGLPGSGKTTFAKLLGGEHVEADLYFITDGEYKFNPSKIKDAHEWCQDIVESYLRNEVEQVIVSNTFTQDWEMQLYMDLANKYGYRVTSLIVENRHGSNSVHNVPEETIDKMKKRFQIKL